MLIDLYLAGKLVIVIGGGTEGTRKVKSLLGQNCKIMVVTNRLNKFLRDQAKKGKIDVVKTTLKDATRLDRFEKPYLVIACTNDRLLNMKLVQKAKRIGAIAYAVDDPEVSDFSSMAIANIDDMLFVGISTKGKSPLMGRLFRKRIERSLKRYIHKELPSEIKD
ncbi:MAG: bifunctional precorrin-2 dehydrogenase/sirohydrochlorin ferrochelatase [Nitrososphaerales archaeon]